MTISITHPSRPIRLAILEADQPLPNTLKTYGGYGGVFKRLLRRSGECLNLTPEKTLEISTYPIWEENNYPNIDEIDAILITGSKFSAYDDLPWINRLIAFTKKCIESNRVRVVGICFGHQIASRALGGRVIKNEKGWEVAALDVPLSEKGKEIFGKDKIKIYQMHRDIVPELPPAPEGKTISNIGSTEVCNIQGMHIPKTLISVQGHPEFDSEIVSEIVDSRGKYGILQPEEVEDARKRLSGDDGVEIGTKVYEFLLEDFE